MVRNNVDLYLDAVEKNLICGKKYRKVLMKQLAADVEDFSDEHSGELTMEELELRFGTTGEVAELLPSRTGADSTGWYLGSHQFSWRGRLVSSQREPQDQRHIPRRQVIVSFHTLWLPGITDDSSAL